MTVRTNVVVSSPRTVMAQDSITRLANTTQYAVQDCLSDHATTPTAAGYFSLEVAGLPGGGGRIVSAVLTKSDDDVTAADFDVILFDTLPAVTGFEDNAECAITVAEWAQAQVRLRFVNGSWTRAGTVDVQDATISEEGRFVCASGSKTLYGVVVLMGTYTPASGEVFTLTVFSVPD